MTFHVIFSSILVGSILNVQISGSTKIGTAPTYVTAKAVAIYVFALGDAGATVTDNKEIADKVKAYGNYGSDYKYHHIYKGNIWQDNFRIFNPI